MNLDTAYQNMLDRFNRKRDLHQKAHIYYKNRDMKVFIIPLMIVQFISAIVPQIDAFAPDILGVVSSAMAAMSAIWLGFQGKKRYNQRSESHKNAASIFQHLAVLSMVEKQKERIKSANPENEPDLEKYFVFQKMTKNIESKAKDDENLVPVKIEKQYKKEKEEEKIEIEKIRKWEEGDDEELAKSSDKDMKKDEAEDRPARPGLPAILNEEMLEKNGSLNEETAFVHL